MNLQFQSKPNDESEAKKSWGFRSVFAEEKSAMRNKLLYLFFDQTIMLLRLGSREKRSSIIAQVISHKIR